MTQSQVDLPRWIRWIFLFVADAPWTNIKTANALLLTNATALYVGICAGFKISIDHDLFDSWLIFLGGLLGIATIAAGIKRATYKPAPPNTPDVEDATAAAGAATPTQPATPAPSGQ